MHGGRKNVPPARRAAQVRPVPLQVGQTIFLLPPQAWQVLPLTLPVPWQTGQRMVFDPWQVGQVAIRGFLSFTERLRNAHRVRSAPFRFAGAVPLCKFLPEARARRGAQALASFRYGLIMNMAINY